MRRKPCALIIINPLAQDNAQPPRAARGGRYSVAQRRVLAHPPDNLQDHCHQAPAHPLRGSSSAPLLVVFRLIQGTAAASGVVIARAVVRDVYQGSDVARFLALTMLISGLAPILAPMLGGQLLRVTSCLLPHRRPFTREEIRCQPCIHGATRRPRGRSLVVMPIPPRAVRPKGAAPGGAKVTPAAHVAGCPYLLPAHPFVSSLPSSRRLPGSLFFPLPPRVASTCVT